MTKTLEEILEFTAADASKTLKTEGKMRFAHCLGFKRGSDELFYHAIDMDEHGKAKLAMMVALSLRAADCDRYGFAYEVWMSAAAATVPGLMPKDASDVQDGLSVMACDATSCLMRTYLVEKKRGRVELVLRDEGDTRKPGFTAGGRWATLLAPNFDPMGQNVEFKTEGGNA